MEIVKGNYKFTDGGTTMLNKAQAVILLEALFTPTQAGEYGGFDYINAKEQIEYFDKESFESLTETVDETKDMFTQSFAPEPCGKFNLFITKAFVKYSDDPEKDSEEMAVALWCLSGWGDIGTAIIKINDLYKRNAKGSSPKLTGPNGDSHLLLNRIIIKSDFESTYKELEQMRIIANSLLDCIVSDSFNVPYTITYTDKSEHTYFEQKVKYEPTTINPIIARQYLKKLSGMNCNLIQQNRKQCVNPWNDITLIEVSIEEDGAATVTDHNKKTVIHHKDLTLRELFAGFYLISRITYNGSSDLIYSDAAGWFTSILLRFLIPDLMYEYDKENYGVIAGKFSTYAEASYLRDAIRQLLCAQLGGTMTTVCMFVADANSTEDGSFPTDKPTDVVGIKTHECFCSEKTLSNDIINGIPEKGVETDSEYWHHIKKENDYWRAVATCNFGVWSDWSFIKIKEDDEYGTSTDFAPERSLADVFYGEEGKSLALAIDMSDDNSGDWRWAVLDNDTEITIQHINPLWDRNATSSFSHSISLKASKNIHIIGTASTVFGNRLFNVLYGKRFRLLYGGTPILTGVVHLDNEVSIENDEFEIELAGGNSEFKDDVEDMNCQDIIPLSTAITDSLGMGKTITQTYGNKPNQSINRLVLGTVVNKIDLYTKNYIQAKFKNYRYSETEYRVYGDLNNKGYVESDKWTLAQSLAVDMDATIRYKSLTHPKNLTYKDGFPYCFIRKCWQKYEYIQNNDEYIWRAVDGRPYQDTDILDNDSFNNHYYTPSFYVAYFFDMLWKQTGYTQSQNDMEDIEDWWRLAFVNGTIGFDTSLTDDNLIGKDNNNTKELSSMYRMQYKTYSNYGITVPRIIPCDDTSVTEDGAAYFGSMHVDNTIGEGGVWTLSKETVDYYFPQFTSYWSEPYMDGMLNIGSMVMKANLSDAFANGNNFPAESITSMISAIEAAFNLRFIFSSSSKQVRIVNIDRVLADNNIIHHIVGNATSITRQDTGIAGFRLTYSNSNKSETDKYNKDLAKYNGDSDDAHYNYTNFKNAVTINGELGSPNAADQQVYIDLRDGNSYRVRVWGDATNSGNLYPSWFETAEYIPVEYGDCSEESERLGRVEEVSIAFSPVVMNAMNVSNASNKSSNPEWKYGFFYSEKIYANEDPANNQVAVNCEGQEISSSSTFYSTLYTVKDGSVSTGNSDKITMTASGKFGYSFTEPISFEEHSIDAEHPLQHKDLGFMLGIMRGGGNISNTNSFVIDEEGCKTWSVRTHKYGCFHGDTMDQSARLFDYNGDDNGIGGAFADGKSIVYREDIMTHLRDFGAGEINGHTFVSNNANILNSDRFNGDVSGVYLSSSGSSYKSTFHNNYLVLYTSIRDIKGEKMLLTPIQNNGYILSENDFEDYVSELKSASDPVSYDASKYKLIITTNASSDIEEFFHNLISLYVSTTKNTMRMKIPDNSSKNYRQEAITELNNVLNSGKYLSIDYSSRKTCTANSGLSEKLKTWNESSNPVVPIYIDYFGQNIYFVYSAYGNNGKEYSIDEVKNISDIVAFDIETISEAVNRFDNIIGIISESSIKSMFTGSNIMSEFTMYIKELLACASGLSPIYRSKYEISKHTELDGRISLKLKAEKPVYTKGADIESLLAKGVIHAEDNGNGTKKYYYTANATGAAGRGLFDKFYRRYAEFVTQRKILTATYPTINLSTITSLNDELLYEIGGVSGFIKEYEYKISNKGIRNAIIKLYYK